MQTYINVGSCRSRGRFHGIGFHVKVSPSSHFTLHTVIKEVLVFNAECINVLILITLHTVIKEVLVFNAECINTLILNSQVSHNFI